MAGKGGGEGEGCLTSPILLNVVYDLRGVWALPLPLNTVLFTHKGKDSNVRHPWFSSPLHARWSENFHSEKCCFKGTVSQDFKQIYFVSIQTSWDVRVRAFPSRLMSAMKKAKFVPCGYTRNLLSYATTGKRLIFFCIYSLSRVFTGGCGVVSSYCTRGWYWPLKVLSKCAMPGET